MGHYFTMKITFLTILLASISISAQFTYPSIQIPNPIEERDAQEEFEHMIIGNRRISEVKTVEKTDSKTDVRIKRMDKNGTVLFSSWSTELSASQPYIQRPGPVDFPQPRKDEYKVNLANGKIISFEYSSADASPKVIPITYDSENNISKIEESGITYEYFYEKGKLSKATTFNGNLKYISTYQYDSAGRPAVYRSELVFPNGQSKVNSTNLLYDINGNITLVKTKTKDAEITEKQYTYSNNLLTKFLYTFGKDKKEERIYEYDGKGKLKAMTKIEYDLNPNVMKNKAVFQYNYNNELVTERIRTLGYGESKATYTDVFSYDNQKRLVNIKTLDGKNVFTNIDVTYDKNTITLTRDKTQSVYTFYE